MSSSPIASAGSSRWRTVVPPIAVPAAYLDFAFAGNGDLLVVGTDLITDPKLALWIARYTPDGTRISKKTVDRRVRLINADWIDVDPSDDTVAFTEFGATGTPTLHHVSAATGKTLDSVQLQPDVRRVAFDSQGRMFATTPWYSTSNVRRPCRLNLLGSGGGIADGVDWFLEPCETRLVPSGDPYFVSPHEITVGASGNLIFVDQDQDEAGYFLAPRIAVIRPRWQFVRSWPLPFEWKPGDLPYGIVFSSFVLAGSSDDEVYLGETLVSDDGSHSIGNRVRHFSRTGALLEVFGMGGDQAGVTWPSHPVVDASDHLWVIDLDTATRAYSIKVLE